MKKNPSIRSQTIHQHSRLARCVGGIKPSIATVFLGGGGPEDGNFGGASRVGNGENPGSLSNVAHEKGLFLKDSFPVGISICSGTMLKFQGVMRDTFKMIYVCGDLCYNAYRNDSNVISIIYYINYKSKSSEQF